jgi:inner membrane protein
VLIGLGLLSHLVLDSWNSYGVHPFWPMSSRWYYGDAIYILEPWLWIVLGVAATLSTRDVRGRVLLGAAIALLTAALAWFGMIGLSALVALAVVSAALVMVFRGWNPRRRAGVAVAITTLFVVTMFVLRERVRTVALRTIAPSVRSRIVDVILSPEPANPLCWSALTVSRDVPTTQYVLTRGTVAPVVSSGCDSGPAPVVWDTPVRQSLPRLRELARIDCSVRAWLQFGRAPELAAGAIGDLRYGGAMRENFSRMPLRTDTPPALCPPHLTHWGMPRADLMEPALD